MSELPANAATQPRQARIAVLLYAGWPRVLLPADALVQLAVDATVAPIPNCPGWLRGALGQRGAIVPVFDLGAWAGEAPSPLQRAPIVVIDSGPRVFALVCAAAPDVVEARRIEGRVSDGLPARLHPYLVEALSAGDSVLPSFEVRRWIADCAASMAA